MGPICPEVHELWWDKQTDRQTDITILHIYRYIFRSVKTQKSVYEMLFYKQSVSCFMQSSDKICIFTYSSYIGFR